MEQHRPGPLKQSNKQHKTGKHRSKGQLNKLNKGKVSVVQCSKRHRAQQSKQDRRNRAAQVRKNKREELLSKKRSIGGERSPPHYVTVISLSQSCSAEDVLKRLSECDDQATCKASGQGTVHVSYPRLKQRVGYIVPDTDNLAAVLEAVRVCDTVLFLWSLVDTIDDEGEKLFSYLYAQGLPATAHALLGLKGIPMKKQGEVKKMLTKEIEDRLTEGKIHPIDTDTDALNLVRFLTQQKVKIIKSREMRPHILAEKLEYEPNPETPGKGLLRVTGYLRGPGLSVNRLVHIPGFGDYQMNKITAPTDPFPLILRPDKVTNDEDMNGDTKDEALLASADPSKQESLQSENVPDPLDGEQTWPTDEELADAANAAMEAKKTMVKVPKGTSSYQAAWIADAPLADSDGSDEDEDDEDSEEDMDDEFMDNDAEGSDVSGEDFEEIETGSAAPSVNWADDLKYDEKMDMEQEQQALEKYKLERENEMFPDEVDTPEDMPARLRFARYRGLKSFRTSPWDTKENLPMDYSRIFQFENFARFKKYVLKEEIDDAIVPGWYITVEVKDVPQEVYKIHSGSERKCPLVLVGLLPNEQRMSVLHFLVRRHHSYTEPIKSKERLVVQCGFRRFACNPIFSDHSNLDKHKYERFLPQSGVCVLSTYAPITFPPSSVLIFKESGQGHDLVANGSLLAVDPNRLTIKRVVLSGHPYKINKKMAVIRYMFYNREDIDWFKPIELKTKWGRRGHIKEPLGTHGHMKCIFDNQLKSQDTILMMLYKRVFPKWTYSDYVPALTKEDTGEMDDEVENERRKLFS